MNTLTDTLPVTFAMSEEKYNELTSRIKYLEDKNDGLNDYLHKANSRTIDLAIVYQKQIKEQAEKIAKLEKELEYTKLFSAKFCDEQEGIWDSTESQPSPQIASDYIETAKYLQEHYRRDNNRIEEIQDWLGRPWEH